MDEEYTVESPAGFSRPPYGSFAGKPQPAPVQLAITGSGIIQDPLDVILGNNPPLGVK